MSMTTTAERLANNAVITMIARAAMAVCGLLFVPAVIAIFQMSASIERLASSNREIKTELAARIDQAESRINLRLAPLESQRNTYADRLRDQDGKIESLTDKVTQITVQVAVLVERINALLSANQRPSPPR